MAYVEWIVTSLTSLRIADAEKTAGYFFGTLNGVRGHWLRIPETAPAIGNITLIASPVASGFMDGLYFDYANTTHPAATVSNHIIAKTIVGYERGGRWINFRAAGVAWTPPQLIATSAKKMARLYYRSANDYVGPTA
jgi:hypothetical protein